jgi:D-glycero-alpha-D-manno-heptose-7-phosphate kinase
VAYSHRTGGLQIEIDSESPPRSALGGSSVAAVALVTALSRFFEQEQGAAPLTPLETALRSHAIEESAAGVPCGMQDHLAAVYGGVNRWDWQQSVHLPPFRRKQLIPDEAALDFSRSLLVAYCGIPHTSKDVNGIWIEQFLSGKTRTQWIEIALCSNRFSDALERLAIVDAVTAMNREMAIRKEMTPGVLDDLGNELVSAATMVGCGARITGAGGGGCIWALGEPDAIIRLRPAWEKILSRREDARILDCNIDSLGVTTHT